MGERKGVIGERARWREAFKGPAPLVEGQAGGGGLVGELADGRDEIVCS